MPASNRFAEPPAKRGSRPVEGEGVRLRPLAASDLPSIRAWRNRDDVRIWFRTTEPISPEGHAAWWQGYLERDDDLVFVIEERLDTARFQSVGTISLYAIDPASRRAELGRVMIGEPGAAGRGFARRATELLVRHAFEELGLAEVHLEVRAENARAIALYRRCGFAAGEPDDGWLVMRRLRGAP